MICTARLLTTDTVDTLMSHSGSMRPVVPVQPKRQGATCIHEKFDIDTAEVKVCGKPVLMAGKHAWLCGKHYDRQQGERHNPKGEVKS